MAKVDILHITPHLGAGVGTVVLNYMRHVKDDPDFTHTVVCLDYANDLAKQISAEVGFKLHGDMSKNRPGLLKMIAESDIIFVHWWNHPLLYDLIIREELPECRLILWSHAAGYPPPITVTDKILRYPDEFVFTSPLSYTIREVQNLPPEIRGRLKDIWSTGGLDRVKNIRTQPHEGFVIGYIGTVDYTKMHPNFLDICDRIDIPDVMFVIVGGPNYEELAREVVRRGISHKFTFTGFVPEEEKWRYLSTFDLLGYPLAPHHYGTCDQVIQEAMAVGIIPVTLNNPMERYMVRDETGIVAENIDEYIRSIETLYRNAKRREELAENSKKYAREIFSLEKMKNEWNSVFHSLLKKPKTSKAWDIEKRNIKPHDIFIEALGDHSRHFRDHRDAISDTDRKKAEKNISKLAESHNWRSRNKSTVHQYNTFLPGDEYLTAWSSLMK